MFLFSNFYLSSFVLGLRCLTHFLVFILVITNIIQLILLRRHKDEYYNDFCPQRDCDPVEAMNFMMVKAFQKVNEEESIFLEVKVSWLNCREFLPLFILRKL